jgi:hypothetical protein
MIDLRLKGYTLERIGEMMKPPVRPPSVCVTIQRGLCSMVAEPVEEIRRIESERLDELQTGIYAKAINGDLQALDRLLKIHDRRVRLLGLAVKSEPEPLRVEVFIARMAEDLPMGERRRGLPLASMASPETWTVGRCGLGDRRRWLFEACSLESAPIRLFRPDQTTRYNNLGGEWP